MLTDKEKKRFEEIRAKLFSWPGATFDRAIVTDLVAIVTNVHDREQAKTTRATHQAQDAIATDLIDGLEWPLGLDPRLPEHVKRINRTMKLLHERLAPVLPQDKIAARTAGGAEPDEDDLVEIATDYIEDLEEQVANQKPPDLSSPWRSSFSSYSLCAGCGEPLDPHNAWMDDGCPCNSPLGCNRGNPLISEWRQGLIQEERHKVEKLQKFKDYVHERLDAFGVPTDPDPVQNHKTGCRIGSRLDVVFRQVNQQAPSGFDIWAEIAPELKRLRDQLGELAADILNWEKTSGIERQNVVTTLRHAAGRPGTYMMLLGDVASRTADLTKWLKDRSWQMPDKIAGVFNNTGKFTVNAAWPDDKAEQLRKDIMEWVADWNERRSQQPQLT
jgi:hypothetical protein